MGSPAKALEHSPIVVGILRSANECQFILLAGMMKWYILLFIGTKK